MAEQGAGQDRGRDRPGGDVQLVRLQSAAVVRQLHRVGLLLHARERGRAGMTRLLADLRWRPGRGVDPSPRRLRWHQVRTHIEVLALNAPRLAALVALARRWRR